MTTREFPIRPATMEKYNSDGSVDLFIAKKITIDEVPGRGYTHVFQYAQNDEEVGAVFIREITAEVYGRMEARDMDDQRIVVRAYDEYDPVRLGMTGYSWPKSVIADAMQGETDPMNLYALVDVNGDVATLMQDSPSAAYTRFDGAWYLVPNIEAIEDFDLVEVEDTAIDIYDPADQTGKSVKITSMPVKPGEDFRVQARYTGTPESDALQPLLVETVTASLTIPTIASARDFPAAVEFAQTHPEFQWYVERRSKALGLEMEFPWRE